MEPEMNQAAQDEPSATPTAPKPSGIRFADAPRPPPESPSSEGARAPMATIPETRATTDTPSTPPTPKPRGIRFAGEAAPTPPAAPSTPPAPTASFLAGLAAAKLSIPAAAQPPNSPPPVRQPADRRSPSPPRSHTPPQPSPHPPNPPPTDTLASFIPSPVDVSTAHRAIRTLMHENFGARQSEAEAEHRRLRTYLVAADLSEEAAYALEWAVRSFLRDGDTLLAIFAMDAPAGGRSSSNSSGGVGRDTPTHGRDTPSDQKDPPSWRRDTAASRAHRRSPPDGAGPPAAGGRSSGQDTPPGGAGLPIGGGGAAMLDAQATIRRLNTASSVGSLRLDPHRSLPEALEAAAGGDAAALGRAERVRLHAIGSLSYTCLQALRRTRLEVQVAIEVIHCKSPKHMITEAIDTLDPTLVILGSRGRSALRGVILGSFSNYLVTKSSVPVMVARKRAPKKEPRAILRQVPTDQGAQSRLVTAKVE